MATETTALRSLELGRVVGANGARALDITGEGIRRGLLEAVERSRRRVSALGSRGILVGSLFSLQTPVLTAPQCLATSSCAFRFSHSGTGRGHL